MNMKQLCTVTLMASAICVSEAYAETPVAPAVPNAPEGHTMGGMAGKMTPQQMQEMMKNKGGMTGMQHGGAGGMGMGKMPHGSGDSSGMGNLQQGASPAAPAPQAQPSHK
jgi:hypothetical protein